MSSSKLEFGYWKYRGLAHPLRFILQYLGVDYEEKNFSIPEGVCIGKDWLSVRDNIRKQYPTGLAFPNLPYLVDGENKVSESRAIMRYIARKYGPHLLGKTPEIQTKIDMLENFAYDFWYMDFATGLIYQHTKEGIENFNSEYPLKMGHISKFVGDNKWCTGDDITYMDFWLCELLLQLTKYDAKILDPFPNLKRLRDNFTALPAIAAYMKTPNFITKCYSSRANYQI